VATRQAIVRHAEGLHARPSELVARLALRFESTVELLNGSHRVDAKSILDVLTLGATEGTELVVEAKGPDAEIATEAVADLVGSDFPEINQTNKETDTQGML
jgi:phosphocarrier protein HPr